MKSARPWSIREHQVKKLGVSTRTPEERLERLRDAARRVLSQAALTGVPLSEVIALLRDMREGMEP